MSLAEFKRNALDVGEWLWGAAQGGFNDKLSIGQIVLDAIISAFPIAGEITAARDVIAQLIRMCKDPYLWEKVLEWIALLLPLLAIVPIAGGLLKGIGKLLMRVGRSAAEDREILMAIIKLCNRLGEGNAVRYIKELDFNKYRQPLLDGFNAICKRLDGTLAYLSEKFKSVFPKEVIEEFNFLREQLAKLQKRGKDMIPECIKELNARLARIRAQIVEGELHVTTSGSKATTREAEARLREMPEPARKPLRPHGHPQNKVEDYVHADGWPDLGARAVYDKDLRMWRCEAIEAFSGKIEAVLLEGPKTLYRVLKPGLNSKPSPWWTEVMPKNAKEWREGLAVLDKFNMNSYFIKYEIPAGKKLNVWKGKAAEQFDKNLGQYLPGGTPQLFIKWPKEMASDIEKLPELATGWGKTLARYGYEASSNVKKESHIEELGKNEFARKQVRG